MKEKIIFFILSIASFLSIVGFSFYKHDHMRTSETQKIKHIVIIMQENRSFDSYFGTFPGANGIPMKNAVPVVCVNNPQVGECVKPYHDTNDTQGGGPHGEPHAIADIDGGKMDGFIVEALKTKATVCNMNNPDCSAIRTHDVMGYHTEAEIPNYWAYAKNFVLQDNMFASTASWTFPEHLFLVSGWSARCTQKGNPQSCVNTIETFDNSDFPPDRPVNNRTPSLYSWTDITYLLYRHRISWAYYVSAGLEPDCENDSEILCVQRAQSEKTPNYWNPLPYFDTVQQDRQLNNIQSLDNFYTAARDGKLPAVSWIIPSDSVSEHPPQKISAGQTYVTGLINAIMKSPNWNSTVILLSWDEWGGFYDHVVPPVVDGNGYGIRVPGLVISPYAKKGYIDHQVLSHDAYIKFIEDVFLHGQRLDPKTDGRPDPRLTVRENVPELGDIFNDLDLHQTPLPPFILNTHPKSDLRSP